MIPLYVVDEFEAITALVNSEVIETIKQNEIEALGRTKIEAVSFHKGTYEELLETLAQKDQSKTQRNLKYPLVWLQQPFYERQGRTSGFETEFSGRLLIIHQTVQDYKITDRYSKVFKPVLYPIYWSLLNQITLYKGIVESDVELIERDKADLPLGNKQQDDGRGNLLNDFVDAIDISNLNLKFYKKTC